MHYSTHLLRHLRRTIGHNIHHWRAHKKLPLSKLASTTGISESMLDRYELGKHEIDVMALLKIACALGVEVGPLLEYRNVGEVACV